MSQDYSLGSVEVAQSPVARYEEFLQSRGKRMTQPKRQLLEHVFTRHEHFDAESLIEQLPSSGKAGHIGRATVYRALREFVDAGLLREFQLHGRSVYEHDYGYPQHDHLYCRECHKLIEFQSDELIQLREAVAREHRFRVTGHRLIISGICEKCRQAKSRSRRKLDGIKAGQAALRWKRGEAAGHVRNATKSVLRKGRLQIRPFRGKNVPRAGRSCRRGAS